MMLEKLRAAALALAAGLLGTILAPLALADEFDHKTVVTFSEPVEIPGRVLPAGTYVFKLADSQSNRHIVQILNQSENKVFATLLATPEETSTVPEKTIISFAERPAGSPEAVKSWFYPGDTIGEEFVYPRTKARLLAKDHRTAVKSMPDLAAANITKSETPTERPAEEQHVMELKQVPIQIMQPKEAGNGNVDIVEVDMPPAISASAIAALPETAGTIPRTAAIGFSLLLAAGLVCASERAFAANR